MTIGLDEPFTGLRGYVDVIQPANPAAGANYNFTFGSLNVAKARVVSVIATLATDANVANRFLSVDYLYRGSTALIRNAATTLITANTSATVFQWDTQHMFSDFNSGTMVFVPLVSLVMDTNWTVQITLDNKQAGDQISAIGVVLEKFYADTPDDYSE